jgi:hypothetical protein
MATLNSRTACTGASHNLTIFVEKIDRYKIKLDKNAKGIANIINGRFLMITDDIMPLGVDLHLTFDRPVEKKPDKIVTGNVNRASYTLPNCEKHRIYITISPNYQKLSTYFKVHKKYLYPNVLLNFRTYS